MQRVRRPDVGQQWDRRVIDAINAEGIRPGEEFTIQRYVSPTANAVGKSRHGGPGTSPAAAKLNFPSSGSQRGRALAEVQARGAAGATRDELQVATGIDLQSLSPRISELKDGGWIEPNGQTRTSDEGAQMEVYVLTLRGRSHFASLGSPLATLAPPEPQAMQFASTPSQAPLATHAYDPYA